jgi:hypothetical protein
MTCLPNLSFAVVVDLAKRLQTPLSRLYRRHFPAPGAIVDRVDLIPGVDILSAQAGREEVLKIKFEPGQIAQLDPNRPVVWERVRCGQDSIVSGGGANVEAPGSRIGLAEVERTPAQNDTVFSLQRIFPFCATQHESVGCRQTTDW